MSRWPRVFEQMLTAYATAALARWVRQLFWSTHIQMGRSPFFLRITERALHEWDHLPHRLRGQAVPPFEPQTRDTKIGAYIYLYEIGKTYSDYEEVHDAPSPFPMSQKSTKTGGFEKTRSAPTSEHSSQRSESMPPPKTESDRIAQEIRQIQEKLRRR